MGPVWSAPRGRRPATDHVVVLGVPEAGRKTLAGYFLLNGAALRPAEPVIAGMQVLTGQRALPTGRVMRVTTWSVGGSDRVKPLWPVRADGATRVVFAVDAAGPGPVRRSADVRRRVAATLRYVDIPRGRVAAMDIPRGRVAATPRP